MLLAGTLDVSAKTMLRHSQSLKFLREWHSPVKLIFQCGQSLGTVQVWGSSGIVTCQHTWCFSKFIVLTKLRFEIPQGMSLAGTLDVSETSMLRHSQGLRFFRECRSPAHLMFQLGQCFDTDKVWGSSEIVARRNTWCLSEVNAWVLSTVA